MGPKIQILSCGVQFFFNYEEVLIFEKVNLNFSIILFLLNIHNDSKTAFLALGNTLQEFA